MKKMMIDKKQQNNNKVRVLMHTRAHMHTCMRTCIVQRAVCIAKHVVCDVQHAKAPRTRYG